MPADAPIAHVSANMTPAPEPRRPAPTTDEVGPAARRSFLATGWDKLRDNALPGLAMTIVAGLVIFTLEGTGDRITRLEDSIDARFLAVDARLTKFEDKIDARFTKLEDKIDARFLAVDARFTKLEESQQDIAQTLAVLVALFEANNQADATHQPDAVPDGQHVAVAVY